ncbi:MAG: GntR family transcriptional regulator [Bacteroidetes bacterium]|nr:GntR family transcriptional regulator [Bacteroidota bacterium]
MSCFSQSVSALRSSAIRDLMSLATRPDMISFAGGMPDNELFPIREVQEIVDDLSVKERQVAMQYAPTTGYPPLLDALGEWLREKGFPMDNNKLIITTGSLQAINIWAKMFIDPGDVVLTENPAFIGALSAFGSYMPRIHGIEMDGEGILIELLKEALKLDPKFLYVTPTFHNPAGLTYSPERRKELLEVMNATEIPILEDDAYGELWFDEVEKQHIVPLKIQSEKEQQICYTGSFSKIFGPGMRLGWMLVGEEFYRKAELCKQCVDACSPTFTQVLAHRFLASGQLDSYVASVRGIYHQRCNYMKEAIKCYFPAEASFVEPKGGFYIWIKLPDGVDEMELLKKVIAEGAVFVVGSTFDPQGASNGYIRVSYCNTDEVKIEKGIKVIGDVLKKMMV